MTAVLVEPRPWPWRRRLGVITLIFIVQLALIFWLGSRDPIRPRSPAESLTLRFAGPTSAELRVLNDPTLFTLPHSQRYAAPASASSPSTEPSSFEWSVPTNGLSLALDKLGSVFSRLVETSDFRALQLPAQPEAAPTIPQLVPLNLPAARSTVELEGDLQRRRLLTPLELKPQPSPDILTNTVVQLGIGADGLPVSVTLLSSSGSAAADRDGLSQAWTARFEPAAPNLPASQSQPTTDTTWGRMVFRWHTVPMPPPNTPAPAP